MKISRLALILAAILSVTTPSHVRAEEGGTGHHLPGSGVFLAGVLPAEPGFTVRFSDWFYAGSADSTRPLSSILQNAAQTNDGIGSIFSAIKNGNAQLPPRVAILAGQLQDRVQATEVNLALDSVQNISTITLLYELPWKPLGTRVVTGVSLPFLYVRTTAMVEVRGPKQTRSACIREDGFGFSDMVATPVILGWNAGNFHWSTGLSIYAPAGQYSPNDCTTGLAGTYAVGPSIGYTWKTKLSVSGQWLYEFDVGNRFQGNVASLVASWTF